MNYMKGILFLSIQSQSFKSLSSTLSVIDVSIDIQQIIN